MARYIDADAYKNVLEKLRHKGIFPKSSDVEILRNYLDEFPTADVVSRERFDRVLENLKAVLEERDNAEPIPQWRGCMDGCLPYCDGKEVQDGEIH